MQYSVHRPAPPLDRFVDFFWMMAGGQADQKERILPSATSELVINLHENVIRIYDSVQPERYRRLSGAVISGTYSNAFICDAMQHQSMLGIHFKPGGAFSFLGSPASQLTDAHVDLEDLWGSSPVRSLRARLCEATTPQERFQFLEEALTERIHHSSTWHPAMELALHVSSLGHSSLSSRDIARQAGVSQRRLIQLFATHVGLTPKLLSRILRFQRARILAETSERRSLAGPQRPAIDWARIALACGYYDQSHLIHEFHDFSGLSPSEYIRYMRQARASKENHVPLPE